MWRLPHPLSLVAVCGRGREAPGVDHRGAGRQALDRSVPPSSHFGTRDGGVDCNNICRGAQTQAPQQGREAVGGGAPGSILTAFPHTACLGPFAARADPRPVS